MDGLEVMQGYGCWCMEFLLEEEMERHMVDWIIVKMLQNNGQDIHMCNSISLRIGVSYVQDTKERAMHLPLSGWRFSMRLNHWVG